MGQKDALAPSKKREKVKRPCPPRTAATTLTIPEGCAYIYAEAMTEARVKIDPKTLGIGLLRTRKAVTGALVLEVPGRDAVQKADQLAKLMDGVLKSKEVRVSRFSKRAELRVRGLEDFVTPEIVAEAVALVGGRCPVEQVRVGVIRSMPTGLGSCWAPLSPLARRRMWVGSLWAGSER